MIYTLDSEQCFTYVNSKILSWGYVKEDSPGTALFGVAFEATSRAPIEIDVGYWRKTGLKVEVLTKSGEPRSVMVSVSPSTARRGDSGCVGIAEI